MKITVELLNATDAQRELQEIRENAESGMLAFWRQIGVYMVKQTVKERFDKQQSPDGTPWKAWSARYAERVQKHGRPHRILKDTGELRRIQSEAHENHVLIGSNKVYAATHQFGDSRRNIPARPFLGINNSEVQEVQKRLERYLERHGLK